MVSCSCSYGNDACAGGWYTYGWDYANVYSVVYESNYPYYGGDVMSPFENIINDCHNCTYTSGTGVVRVSSQYIPQSYSVPAMKTAIATGPISVAVDATNTLFKSYSSGIITSFECGTLVSLAANVVGYGTDP